VSFTAREIFEAFVDGISPTRAKRRMLSAIDEEARKARGG
jgi:hypothetical protein